MKRSRLFFLLASSVLVACAARTEIGDDDGDSSLPDASSPDATFPDVTPPPPDDAQPPPPPDDAGPPPPPPIDAGPPPPPDDAGPPPPPIDASPPPFDAEPPPTTCPNTCFTNHVCQQECSPTLTTGRYCCDEQTNSCYAWQGKHCPQTVFDAGTD